MVFVFPLQIGPVFTREDAAWINTPRGRTRSKAPLQHSSPPQAGHSPVLGGLDSLKSSSSSAVTSAFPETPVWRAQVPEHMKTVHLGVVSTPFLFFYLFNQLAKCDLSCVPKVGSFQTYSDRSANEAALKHWALKEGCCSHPTRRVCYLLPLE